MSSNKEIIIIDFDETLYKKDSLITFCKFVYKKHPLQIWAILPQVFSTVLHALKLINTKKYKEQFLLFLYGMDELRVAALAKEFWENTGLDQFNSNITALMNRKEYRIICISASPEIYLTPIMEVYQMEYIGTRLRYIQQKYVIDGENCKGIEKVNRLKKYLNTDTLSIAESYSDSMTDLPLFQLSKKAYWVDENGNVHLLKDKLTS